MTLLRLRVARLAVATIAALGLPLAMAVPPLLRPVVAGYAGIALTVLLLDLTKHRIDRIPTRLRAASLAAIYLAGIAVTATVTARLTAAALLRSLPT